MICIPLVLALVCPTGSRVEAQTASVTAAIKSDSTWQGGYNDTLSIRNGGRVAIKT